LIPIGYRRRLPSRCSRHYAVSKHKLLPIGSK
jgi:hypothetical protein